MEILLLLLLAVYFIWFILPVLFWLGLGLLIDRYCRARFPDTDPDWPYSEIYPSERQIALERDHYRCRVCGGYATQTHHIKKRREGGSDLAYNLLSVCKPCHRAIEP